jgi:hypothetical protein
MDQIQEILTERARHEEAEAAQAEEIKALKLELSSVKALLKRSRTLVEVLNQASGDSFDGVDEEWLFNNEATVQFSQPLRGNRRISIHPRRGTPVVGTGPEIMPRGPALFIRALDLVQDRARSLKAKVKATSNDAQAKRSHQEREARQDQERGISWRRQPGSRAAQSLMPGRTDPPSRSPSPELSGS